jgi:two-component system, NtrC family, sensor histidine kinase KinB
MTQNKRLIILISATLLVVGLLTVPSVSQPVSGELIVAVGLFAWLIVFTITYSVPLVDGALSLMPMTVVAAYLTLGRVPAAWATIAAMLLHAGVRRWRAEHSLGNSEPKGWDLIEVTTINILMHVAGILSAGLVGERLGSSIPLTRLTPAIWVRLIVTFITYLGVNYFLAALYLLMRSWEAVADYIKALPKLLFFEGGPMVFAPLMAIVYTRVGVGYFDLVALLCVVSTLIAHSLSEVSERLARRVRELASLQATGQALSASLDMKTVVLAIYEQVHELMPTPMFYLALYDAELGEVSFPLVIEYGERLYPEPRRMRHGLTEHVLETKQSLLIPKNVHERVEALGLEHFGREAASWLGVPILAGDQVLGMLSVQSYDTSDAYDESHQQVLEVIAAQAGIAIQNARLYERTDEALERRVQELSSVLQTTGEGVMLLDTEWRILALNRALAEFVGVARSDLDRIHIGAIRAEGEPLSSLIHYTMDALISDCNLLRREGVEQIQEQITLEPSGVQVDRTLTPVRDAEGEINGWLLLFRDLSEEVELDRLRQDMTNMLVHDLRSPLSMVIGGLKLLPEAYELREHDRFQQILAMAHNSSDRILTLIDQLLDISQLERGELPLTPEVLEIATLLHEIRGRFASVAASEQIALMVAVDADLPKVEVDRALMLRVFSNLVDNALKFTPDGGRVQLWAERDRESGSEMLRVGVRDTGPGIPLEYMDRVFEKFQQLPSTRGRRRGTGLGLSFCKLVVEAHGGRIWVESKLGEGSTFLMTLPKAKS